MLSVRPVIHLHCVLFLCLFSLQLLYTCSHLHLVAYSSCVSAHKHRAGAETLVWWPLRHKSRCIFILFLFFFLDIFLFHQLCKDTLSARDSVKPLTFNVAHLATFTEHEEEFVFTEPGVFLLLVCFSSLVALTDFSTNILFNI